jgi:hypothetical protein
MKGRDSPLPAKCRLISRAYLEADISLLVSVTNLGVDFRRRPLKTFLELAVFYAYFAGTVCGCGEPFFAAIFSATPVSISTDVPLAVSTPSR